MSDEPVEFPKPEEKPSFKAANLKISADVEPYIEAGMKRTGKTRHGYLVAAVRHVALKEKL